MALTLNKWHKRTHFIQPLSNTFWVILDIFKSRCSSISLPKGPQCGALVFSLLLTWSSGWTNSRGLQYKDARKEAIVIYLVDICIVHDNVLTPFRYIHYSDVIMSTMAPKITGVSIVYSAVCSGTSLALWGEFTGDRWIPRTKGQ